MGESRAAVLETVQEQYAPGTGHGFSRAGFGACARGVSTGERRSGYRTRSATPEHVLHAAWRRAGLKGRHVSTRDGEALEVIYPGRPADGPGPDFRDAVLRRADGTLLRGDVEIHVRPSGWHAHGHDRDRRYNGVAFHVTEPDDSPTRPGNEPRTASGVKMRLLILGGPHGEQPEHAAPPGGDVEPAAPEAPRMALGEAGDRRFMARSSGMQLRIRVQGADDVLWAAVLDCLGYSRNRRAFRDFHRRVPWPVVERLSDGGVVGSELEAEFLYAAGLSDMSGGRTGLAAGRAPEWAPGGRPANSPETRVRAAARLAERWLAGGGPVASALSIVRSAARPADVISSLQTGPPPGGRHALVGRGRAAEISVNAVLPAVHAYAELVDRWDLAERALFLYRGHPRLPENAVTKEMRALLSERGRLPDVKGAREQQGLIFLYRAMTTHGVMRLPEGR